MIELKQIILQESRQRAFRKLFKCILSRNLYFFPIYFSHLNAQYQVKSKYKNKTKKIAYWHEETNAQVRIFPEFQTDINTVLNTVNVKFTHWLFLSMLWLFFFFPGQKKGSKPKRNAPGRENAACPAGHGCWGQSLRLKCVPWMNLPLLLLSTFASNTFSGLWSRRLEKEDLLV